MLSTSISLLEGQFAVTVPWNYRPYAERRDSRGKLKTIVLLIQIYYLIFLFQEEINTVGGREGKDYDFS